MKPSHKKYCPFSTQYVQFDGSKAKKIETDTCVECIHTSLGAWLETRDIWITHIVTSTSPEWITHGLPPPMCSGISSVQCSGPDGGHVRTEHFTHAHRRTTALSVPRAHFPFVQRMFANVQLKFPRIKDSNGCHCE